MHWIRTQMRLSGNYLLKIKARIILRKDVHVVRVTVSKSTVSAIKEASYAVIFANALIAITTVN